MVRAVYPCFHTWECESRVGSDVAIGDGSTAHCLEEQSVGRGSSLASGWVETGIYKQSLEKAEAVMGGLPVSAAGP